MKEQKKATIYVVGLNRLKNSYYGNPKYLIAYMKTWENSNNVYFIETKTNASCAYMIGQYMINNCYDVIIENYRNKNVISHIITKD